MPRPATSDHVRYALASQELLDDPSLHREWATSADRARRRAVMRSPSITPDVAELVVATGRTGMHTMGANPEVPIELLDRNPSARRRHERIDAVLAGGLADLRRGPNRPELVALGSGTVDLALALAPGLQEAVAVALAERTDPTADALTLALLVQRFGVPVRDAVARHASRERRRAVEALAGTDA
jgi:hypothetical protein